LEIPDISTSNPNFQQAYKRVAGAEQKPVQRIDNKVKKAEGTLELVRDFKKRVSEIKNSLLTIRNVNDFRELKGVSSDPGILDVTAIDKSKATPGKYDFEVLNLANTDSIMTYGFEDADESEVGVGYINFKTPEGEEREVYINTDNNTLKGVADTINKAGVGVKAFVVHDGTDSDEPWRLVITGDKTGWKDDFEWPTFYMLDGDLDFDTERSRDAKSAIVRFNGHPVMLDENKIKDLLPGVNIDLKKARPGEVISFEVTPDIQKIRDKVQKFVEATNGALQFIQDQNKLDAKSYLDPKKALGGDVAVQALENRMRTLLQQNHTNAEGATIRRLGDIGIEFNRNGLLDFNGDKFDKLLQDRFDEVATLVSGNGPLDGFANEMIRLVDGIVRSGDGMMSIREGNLQRQVDTLNRQKESAEAQVQRKLERIRTQFQRAEGAIQQMQNFAAGAGVGGGGGAALVQNLIG
jgi:flagellar hook-associated protein 2